MKWHWASGAPGAEVAEKATAAAGAHARGAAGDGQGACYCGFPAGAGLPDAFGDAPESWDPPPALLGQRASQAPRAVAPSVILFVGALGIVEVVLDDVREVRVRKIRERAV